MLSGIVWFFGYSQDTYAFSDKVPNFNDDFIRWVTQWEEKVYDPSKFGIDTSKSFMDNIKNMFYPNDTGWGRMRNIVQYLGVGLFIGMIIYVGIMFLLNADSPDKIKNAQNNMLYLAYGGFLFFAWAAVINILLTGNDAWTGSATLVANIQNKLLLNVIAVLKSIAFFTAFVMIIRYGIKIIQAYDKEDKMKTGITGIINVLAALIFIKILDYVYLMAQKQDFKSRFVDFVIEASKVIWYILGWVMVIYLIYAWFQMVVSNWDSERSKKARTTIKSIFLGAIVIFLFLMIIYTLIKDLW